MEKKDSFRGMSGAYAALFTPYDAKGRVDPEMVARIMDYGYANGLNGFYLTGIDWVSSITPQLYRNSFDAAMYHYRTIAAATDLPFMVYSMGSALVSERDIRLFDIPNVKGMKYTGRDYYAAQCLKRKLDGGAIPRLRQALRRAGDREGEKRFKTIRD